MLYEDAEDAHEAGTNMLRVLHKFGLHPRERGNEEGDLRIEVFGQVLDNPIGTSAGIDKNAVVPSALLALGPSLVEVGGITPLPQEGNPKPRVWRIPSQNALINRYGLNSEGAEYVATQLRSRVRQYARSQGYGIDEEAERIVLNGEAGVPPGALVQGKMLAIQVAKNKDTPDGDHDAVRRDYVACVEHVAKYADVIVVNVSSPNTPGLRSLQKAEPLQHILTGVVGAARAIERKAKPKVMVKVSPDEDSESEVLGICQVTLRARTFNLYFLANHTCNRRFGPQALTESSLATRPRSGQIHCQPVMSSPTTRPTSFSNREGIPALKRLIAQSRL